MLYEMGAREVGTRFGAGCTGTGAGLGTENCCGLDISIDCIGTGLGVACIGTGLGIIVIDCIGTVKTPSVTVGTGFGEGLDGGTVLNTVVFHCGRYVVICSIVGILTSSAMASSVSFFLVFFSPL